MANGLRLRGHSSDMNVPGMRLRYVTATLYGRDVNVIDARDERDDPIRFFYDVASGVPAGFQLIDDAGSDPILTRFTDWRQVDDVLLPFSITITHGADVFIYRVTEASVNSLWDDDFRPTRAISGRN